VSAPLYQISGAYARLLELAEQGEDVAETLSQLDDAIETKGAGIARVLASLDADVGAVDAELARLTARKKAATGNAERLREHVRSCMQLSGITKIKGGTFSITLAAGPDRVEVLDASKLTSEFLRTKPAPAPEPDKRAILDAYKRDGVIADGCEIVPTTRLVIR
jgi:hypothetical protein